ncbi:MAG: family 43 glycosylhydrolase [Bacteroidales bacterium]|nr:family 43 glycosylhydrolase [Bacteroidales bacterium]
MKKQVYNPYLPLNEYVPDGEPHVFGDRVYIFGSHDKEGGETFCMLDYVSYSASIYDLKDWRFEGVIYQAKQDPDYKNRKYMYAPDVVRGNDGKYYLYYCMSGDRGVGGYHGPISVAVSDSPAGKYEYLGCVKYPDGTPMMDYVPFDPAVINDDGVIRVYYGTQYPFEEEDDFFSNEENIQSEMGMFGKNREEILDMARKDSVMGAVMAVLEDDMLTVKVAPKHIIPYKVKGSSFEQHPFFEASSIRKVGNMYYFVYSSMQNHELCYATSAYPDKDFVFGGTIVSNGDVGYKGRTESERLNMTGTTHGSIISLNDKWYVFYHRLTHKSDYSRQACAEQIEILSDGSIPQVEITSCGLNGAPLVAKGSYPAVIACNITNGNMPHGSNKIYSESFPNVNNEGEDRFISEISNKTLIGYKYFDFQDNKSLKIIYKGNAKGTLRIFQELNSSPCGSVEITPSKEWREGFSNVTFANGTAALYFVFEGEGIFDLKDIIF